MHVAPKPKFHLLRFVVKRAVGNNKLYNQSDKLYAANGKSTTSWFVLSSLHDLLSNKSRRKSKEWSLEAVLSGHCACGSVLQLLASAEKVSRGVVDPLYHCRHSASDRHWTVRMRPWNRGVYPPRQWRNSPPVLCPPAFHLISPFFFSYRSPTSQPFCRFPSSKKILIVQNLADKFFWDKSQHIDPLIFRPDIFAFPKLFLRCNLRYSPIGLGAPAVEYNDISIIIVCDYLLLQLLAECWERAYLVFRWTGHSYSSGKCRINYQSLSSSSSSSSSFCLFINTKTHKEAQFARHSRLIQ